MMHEFVSTSSWCSLLPLRLGWSVRCRRGHRFERSRISRRGRCPRATATQPAAQQQLCTVAPCRKVARL